MTFETLFMGELRARLGRLPLGWSVNIRRYQLEPHLAADFVVELRDADGNVVDCGESNYQFEYLLERALRAAECGCPRCAKPAETER